MNLRRKNTMGDQFSTAFVNFSNACGYMEPITYEEWSSLKDDNLRVCYLYCQFYDQITLAWYKAKADFISDADGLSCVLQYLMKNVPKIMNEPKRFTSSYIYRISYNCMDCLRYVQRDKDRYHNETSNVVYFDGEPLDLCDLKPHSDKGYVESEVEEDFWRTIEALGPKAMKVVYHILNEGSLRALSKRSKNYNMDPLRSVSVSPSEYDTIIALLQEALYRFRDNYLC